MKALEELFVRTGTLEGRTVFTLVEDLPQKEGKGKRYKAIQVVEDDNGCLRMVSHKKRTDSGHCQISRPWATNNESGHIYAHSYVWQLMHERRMEEGKQGNHTCDIPDCINPLHVYEGTKLDNSRDMVERNRQAKGEEHGSGKLTNGQALLVMFTEGTQREIAEIFDVHKSLIGYVKNGKKSDSQQRINQRTLAYDNYPERLPLETASRWVDKLPKGLTLEDAKALFTS